MSRSFNKAILISIRRLALVALAFTSACTSTSEGRKQLSLVSNLRAEREGTRAFERIKNRNELDENSESLAYVRCIVEALESTSGDEAQDWEIVVLKDDSANAFALPGKKIAVNSGLLRVAVNQDQVAAVIAHEMAHVQAGHGAERTSQQVALASVGLLTSSLGDSLIPLVKAAGLVVSTAGAAVQLGLLYPFSRIQEEEADLIGLELMANSGFAPAEAIAFWENMDVYGVNGEDGPLSTHPSHQTRIKTLEKRIGDRGWLQLTAEGSVARPACDRDLL